MGEEYQRTPIGTGPFMFDEYQPQQYVKLVANPDYFRGQPKIKEIFYRYIPSDASRDLAFQSGEIDMLSRTTTITLTRDAALGLNFGPPTFYTGTGFMVRTEIGAKKVNRQYQTE